MARAAARKTAPREARGRASHPWLQGLACGALLAFAPSYALLVGALLAPALVAVLLDQRPGRPVARTVFLAGAAFTLAPVWHLFQGGQNVAAALDLLEEPAVTGPAWLAGGLGWALCDLLPIVLRVFSDASTASRVAALQAESKALEEAWDLQRDR